MGYIDAHSHVWDQDFARYPILAEYSPEAMKPATFTPEELLAHAEPCGVDRVVLIQMSYYGTDNSYMVDAIAQRPDTFRGVGVVDHAAGNVEDTMESLRAAGVRGFRIQPGGAEPGEWLGDGSHDRLLAAAGDLRQAVCPLIDAVYLPALGRACERFPGTNFVVDHLARIGVGGVIREEDVSNLCELARCPNALVKVSAFYALGSTQPPHDDLIPLIRRVHESFGAERLMWATDCPYQVERGTYSAGISLVRDRLDFLSDADRQAILGGTAARVFFAD